MKVFFVGDNRTNINWGRGASLALREILEPSFEIDRCVTGDQFDLTISDAGYIRTLMPARYYRIFRYLLERRQKRIIGWYVRFEELMGAHDFISPDPRATVEDLVRYKHRNPSLGTIYDAALASDLMVVDGDGDIIFSTPPRRSTLFLLAMIELGLYLGKPVFLVNSMISDCPVTGRNLQTLEAAKRLLAGCNAVALRDLQSLRYVQREMPDARAAFIPDSLFSWFARYQSASSRPPKDGDFLLPHPERIDYWGQLDFSQPYICIGGGALASRYPGKAMDSYRQLVDAVSKLGYKVYLTESDLPDSFLRTIAAEKSIGIVPADAPVLMCGAVLAHARLFISGRYHPSIFASLGGTPCIFLESQDHKMGSLSEVLEYEVCRLFDAFPDAAQIGEIASLARNYLDQGDAMRTRILSVVRERAAQANALPDFLNRYLHANS